MMQKIDLKSTTLKKSKWSTKWLPKGIIKSRASGAKRRSSYTGKIKLVIEQEGSPKCREEGLIGK